MEMVSRKIRRLYRSVALVAFLLLCSIDALPGADINGACVVACASETIGQREITHNRSPFIDECNRLAKVALGSPWCASVSAMWHHQCGVGKVRSAYSPDWFKTDKCVYIRGRLNDKVLPGDVGGIYFPSKKRIAHLFLVESTYGKWINTIEGNTNDGGDREGDRVMRRKRLKSNVERIARHWDE